MGVEDRICDYCKDVIMAHEDVICIQKGYINQFKEFKSLGKPEARHSKCHEGVEARALVMAELVRDSKFGDEIKNVKGRLEELERLTTGLRRVG